jgi:MoaA/NifB/PqqE/SkfB family radical SAM enzyme
MPESRCNLKCAFCSVINRPVQERLELDLIKRVVGSLVERGLQSVVISGGGEPTIYPQFNELLEFLYDSGLSVGLITNGTKLNKLRHDLVKKLRWIRISANTLDYAPKVVIPELGEDTVLGLSYIVGDDMTDDSLLKVQKLADEYNVRYVRVGVDCLLEDNELEEVHQKTARMVEEFGDKRFFHQYKKHSTPEKCYLGYFHPILYCDGYIYPCDSLVLNDGQARFGDEYRLCHADDIIETLYSGPADETLIDCQRLCNSCVWRAHNDTLIAVKRETEHPEFI